MGSVSNIDPAKGGTLENSRTFPGAKGKVGVEAGEANSLTWV